MEIVKREYFGRRIAERFDYVFSIEKSGLYLVGISARARSRKQLGGSEETLRLLIDGRSFEVQAAFFGTGLRNLKKEVYFILELAAGGHTLSFMPGRDPLLEEVSISFLEADLTPVELRLDRAAEDGDRRSWLTFVLVNVPLRSLAVEATARWRLRDSDDIKLIIDGRVLKNPHSIRHRNWLWAGSILKKLLRKETRTETIETNLPIGVHYVEFWADRMPALERINFTFGAPQIETAPRPRRYVSRGVRGDEDYNRFDAVIADAVKYWNDEFLKQAYPPPEPLDPDLVKAIIYIESRVGYYPGGYPDVMQVGRIEQTLKILNNDGAFPTEYEWSSGVEAPLDSHGEANAQTPDASIHWGVRWLYHKAQAPAGGKPHWLDWQEAIQRYGTGTAKYRGAVWNVYQEGVSPDSIRLWVWTAMGLALLGLSAFSLWLKHNQGRVDIIFRNIPNSQDYHIAARIFNGFWFEEAVVTQYYASGKPRVPRRGDTVETRWLDIDGDGVREIILEGWYRDAYHAAHILRREGSGFKRVDHFEQYGGREEAFAGLAVYFLNADQDDDLEVIERHVYSCRDYPGCPNETWQKYYDLGPDGLYHFTKVEKTPQRKKEAGPSVVF